jgi:trehalose 6-phosphate phosphatase
MRHALNGLPEIERMLEGANRVLLATDFDGTLCPIANNPASVVVPAAMLEVLEQLHWSERFVLAIVSGRSLADITSRLSIPTIFAGNHGLEIEGPGMRFVHEESRRVVSELVLACGEMTDAIRHWRGAWVEDKVLTATVHYRGVDPMDQYKVVLAVRRAMAPFGGLFGMRAGKCAVEIHPRIPWGKGSAVTWIREKFGLSGEPCICMGDDRTDESMFEANAGQVNIRVGPAAHSAAEWYLSDPVEVATLLGHLAHTARTGRLAQSASASGIRT